MKRIKLSILATLFSIATHSYLSWVAYPVKFAQTTGGLACDINATFSCSTVIASKYSDFLGIPLSIWGWTTNLALLIFLLICGFRLTENKAKTLRYAFYLSTVSALASLVMGVISFTMMSAKCPFCMGAYVFSFLTWFLLFQEAKTDGSLFVTADIKDLFGESKSALGIILAIPLFALLIHRAILDQYGADDLDTVVNTALAEWTEGKSNAFDNISSFQKGPAQAKMQIVEFADYLCPHCRHAAPALHAFLGSHEDVRFEFFSYPLDGVCNKAVQVKTDGVRCLLAKAVLCSNSQNKADEIHALLLDDQDSYFSKSYQDAKNYLKSKIESKVDWAALDTCVEAEATQNQIMSQAALGDKSGVQGTPTIFVNGKILPRGQLIPVLQGAYKVISQ